MIGALFIAGIIMIIGGIIGGFQTGSVIRFVLAVTGGVASSCLFFGLASILQNQETILEKIQSIENFKRKITAKKECAKCSSKFDGDLSSCPYCGYRE